MYAAKTGVGNRGELRPAFCDAPVEVECVERGLVLRRPAVATTGRALHVGQYAAEPAFRGERGGAGGIRERRAALVVCEPALQRAGRGGDVAELARVRGRGDRRAHVVERGDRADGVERLGGERGGGREARGAPVGDSFDERRGRGPAHRVGERAAWRAGHDPASTAGRSGASSAATAA